MRRFLLLLIVAAAAAAAGSASAAWTPYQDATATTAKQDFRGTLLLCDLALGWPSCGVISTCHGNCTHAIQKLVESQERVLGYTMFCLANVRMPE